MTTTTTSTVICKSSSNIEFSFQVLVSVVLLVSSVIGKSYIQSCTILVNLMYQLYIKYIYNNNKLKFERQESESGLGIGISMVSNLLSVIVLATKESMSPSYYHDIVSFYQITISIIVPFFLINYVKIMTYYSTVLSTIGYIRVQEYKKYFTILQLCLLSSFLIYGKQQFLVFSTFMMLFGFVSILVTKLLLEKLQNSFTIGEASILSQLITMLISESIRYFYNGILGIGGVVVGDKFGKMNILYCFYSLVLGSLVIVFINSLIGVSKRLRASITVPTGGELNSISSSILIKTLSFYLMVLVIILLGIYPILQSQLNGENPFIWVFEYIASSKQIVYTMCIWLVLLLMTIVLYQPSIHSTIPMILSRKYFHILAVIMFTPPLLISEDMKLFMVLSYSVSISALILLELLKYSMAPPFAKSIKQYMDRFLDNRDSGTITTTHIYLLLGCSIPLFLSFFMGDLIGCNYHFLSPFSGILTIGVGDTMASYFGVKYGQNKWFNSKKSIEGTIAGSIFTILASCLLYSFYLISTIGSQTSPTFATILISIFKIIITSTACSLLEASTTQIDNLILPLFYFTLINL